MPKVQPGRPRLKPRLSQSRESETIATETVVESQVSYDHVTQWLMLFLPVAVALV